MNEKVWFNVDSSAGKDLDRVKLYFIPEGTPPEQIVYNETTLGASVAYGGLPPSAPEDADPSPAHIKNKTAPNRGSEALTGVSPSSTDVGHDNFYFIGFNTRAKRDGTGNALINTEAKFPDGIYNMVIRAHSIRNNNTDIFFDTSTTFLLDNFRPYVEAVEITDSAEPPNIKYQRVWLLEGTTLVSPAAAIDESFVPGETYKARAVFSEYMDDHEVNVNLGGPPVEGLMLSNVPDKPQSQYTWYFTIRPDDFQKDEQHPITIGGRDIAGNEILKLEPGRTLINPISELTRSQTAPYAIMGSSGPDKLHAIRVDVKSPVISYNRVQKQYPGFDYQCAGNNTYLCGSTQNPVNILTNEGEFKYEDVAGSGLNEIKTYKDRIGGVVYSAYAFGPGTYEWPTAKFSIPDGNYVQTITDNLGHATTFYFRVDPLTPRLEVNSIVATGFTNFSVYGVVVDTGSGIDYLQLSMGDSFVQRFPLVSGTTEPVNYSFTGLRVDSEAYYVLTAQDKAGNISGPQPLMQFVTWESWQSVGMESPFNSVSHSVDRITSYGGPCTITLSARNNDFFEIPINPGSPPTVITVNVPEPPPPTPSEPIQPVVHPIGRLVPGNMSLEVSKKPEIIDGEIVLVDACGALVTGRSMQALTLGPRLAQYRNGEMPAEFNINFSPAGAEFTYVNARPDPLNPPRLTSKVITPPAPPAGDANYPPGAPRAWRMEYANMQYDRVDVTMSGLPTLGQADLSNVRMLCYHDGTMTDITTGFTENSVTGTSLTNSTFTLVVPISVFDHSGPVAGLTVKGGINKDDGLYISLYSPVEIQAIDTSSNDHAIAGVATTYYLIDALPTPECLGTAYNPAAPGGTCANPVYAAPFTLAEGRRSVNYGAVDKLGNYGARVTTELYVDATAPLSQLAINGNPVTSGTSVYMAAIDSITLTAEDTVSNNVVSGLATTYFLVDISPEECDYSEGSGGINGVGTCESPYYSGPLALPEGEHTVYYYSKDNMGNLEAIKISSITVDNTAPVSVFEVAGSSRVMDGKLYVLSGSSLAVTAWDALSGVKEIYYSLDGATAAAVSPLLLPVVAGAHTLAFYSADNVGNAEAEKSVSFFVDAEAPVTTAALAGLRGADGWYVSPVTVMLVSTDVMSGVTVGYRVEGRGYSNEEIAYISSFTLAAEGLYTLRYHGIDNAGNVEPENALSFKIDLSSPVALGIKNKAGALRFRML